LGLRSRPHWATGGTYSAPQTLYTWILGVLLLREGEGRGRGEKGKGRGTKRGRELRQAPPSLFPFPIRYATGSGEPFAASGTLDDLTWLHNFLTSK